LFDSDDNFEQENIKDIVLESNNSTSNTNDSISEISSTGNNNDVEGFLKTRIILLGVGLCKHHVKIINGSTGNSINHLSNVHGITKENYKEKNNFSTKQKSQLTLPNLFKIDDPNSKSDYKRLKSVFLTDDEWLLMSDLVQILGPFAEATDLLGGSKYSTFSLIYPTLMALINQLTSDQNNDDDFNVEEESDVFHKAKGLADLIKERLYFALIYYYEKPIQDALIASLLDPRSKCLRFLSQERKSNVIITNLRKEFNYLKNLNNSLQNNSQNTERNLTSKPYKRSLLT
ncbi:10988_t:CDS:2, partial [Entrophospora sp. SA101]